MSGEGNSLPGAWIREPMYLKSKAGLALAASLGPLMLPADTLAVQQAKSLYTTIDLSKCRVLRTPSRVAAWRCGGLLGYPVYVSIARGKTFVSVGRNAARRRAARQTLNVANSLFDGRSARTAVEWRFTIRNGQAVPYATILRYFTRTPGGRGETVVVMRIAEREACQVARIDALQVADAMVIARRVADRLARRFDCRSPIMEGDQVRVSSGMNADSQTPHPAN